MPNFNSTTGLNIELLAIGLKDHTSRGHRYVSFNSLPHAVHSLMSFMAKEYKLPWQVVTADAPGIKSYISFRNPTVYNDDTWYRADSVTPMISVEGKHPDPKIMKVTRADQPGGDLIFRVGQAWYNVVFNRIFKK